jgi:hypothetical protein
MVRLAARGAVALVLVGVVLAAGLAQPPATPDRVYHRDKKDGTTREVVGTLKVAPGGYQVVTDGKPGPLVSPADLVRVVPADANGGPGQYTDAVKAEVARDWEKARGIYAELKKTPNQPERNRRFVEFRLAYAAAKAADDTPEDGGWKEKAKAAADQLGEFLVAYPTGWEVWSAGRTAARLQFELELYQDAARTWARVAKAADLPADLRQEAALEEVDALVRGKQFAPAAARLAEAQKTAAAGAPKDRLNLYQIALKFAQANPLDGVAPIEAEIGKTRDPGTRATGYSLIGELYLMGNKPRDAMWAFLWVEVVYNQNHDEVARALTRLAESYQLQGDEDRAKSYRDKLRRYRATL